MKVKDLIEELKKFNPDGIVSVEILSGGKNDGDFGKAVSVEDEACAMINPVIIARS